MDNRPTFSNPSEVLSGDDASNSFRVNRRQLILQFELEQAKEHRQTVELALEILNKCWERMVPGHKKRRLLLPMTMPLSICSRACRFRQHKKRLKRSWLSGLNKTN